MSQRRPPLAMQPGGVLGRPFGWLMERLNRKAYEATLDALAPASGESVLEIGFGTGAFLERAAHTMGRGRLLGIDPSALMVTTARRRLAPLGDAFVVDLREGKDIDLPEAQDVHRVVAIHSFQFWADPIATLHRLHAMMAADSTLVLTLRLHDGRAPAWLPNPLSKRIDEIGAAIALLGECGFDDAACVTRMRGSSVIRATRPAKNENEVEP